MKNKGYLHDPDTIASSRVSLQRRTGLERWPRRNLMACPMWRLMLSTNGSCPRRGTESTLRSSPFYRPRAPSYVLPLLVIHR
jgi:hypothetical protein